MARSWQQTQPESQKTELCSDAPRRLVAYETRLRADGLAEFSIGPELLPPARRPVRVESRSNPTLQSPCAARWRLPGSGLWQKGRATCRSLVHAAPPSPPATLIPTG